MRSVGCLFVVLSAGVALAAGKAGNIQVGSKIEPFQLRDYRGADRSLKDFSDKKVVVLAFLGCECPVAKLYGPRLAQMAKEFEQKGVAFVGINSNQQDSSSDITKYAKDAHIEFPILKDVNNVLADTLGVQRTPDILVLDSDRVVRYRGRVDDQHLVGVSRSKAGQNYLHDALEEILSGKTVSHPNEPAVGCFVGRVRKPSEKGSVTYTKHIAGILNSRCLECHRPGNIGPFNLGSYEDAVAWADTIDEVVQQGRMPPWHADPKYGHFSNASRLTDAEKKLIKDWVADGSPQGDPKDLPAAPKFTDGWRIPPPDVVFTMAKPFKVPATGKVEYQFFVIDTGFTEDKWVRAAEVKPSCRGVVHHVLVFIQTPEGKLPGPGERGGFITNWLAATVPGARPMILPDGLAKRVPAGSRLIFQMHYTPNGSEQMDQSSLGLVFVDPKTVRKEVVTDMVVQPRFEIPPGDPSYKIENTETIHEDTELWTLMPHTHVRGVAFKYDATYPDGKTEVLLDVPTYDFNWQNSYVLAEPKVLPKGTKLHVEALYNNSASNPANPNPDQKVHWGEQTWEEMMIGYYDRTLVKEDRFKNPPPVAKKYEPKPLPTLEPELANLARHAMDSKEAFNAFATAVHTKLPQVDRVDVASIVGRGVKVMQAAYPGKKINKIAEAGFEIPVFFGFDVAIFALFNQTTTIDDISKVPGLKQGRSYDMNYLGKSGIKSSTHVPVAYQSLPTEVSFWSTQPKAFSPEDALLAKALAIELAKNTK